MFIISGELTWNGINSIVTDVNEFQIKDVVERGYASQASQQA
jgi:hypothetical protein